MENEIDKRTLRRKAEQLCRDHGADLVFLTLFGADLYGTRRSESSDLDVRGLFLPSPETLVLGTAPKSLHFTTGQTDRRNQAGDVDIDLWSVGHWLKLLAAGDIGAMDLIFAPSNREALIYRHPKMDVFFNHPLKLLDTAGGRAYAEYSLSQARKYGIKGSRLGAVKAVHHWLKERGEGDADERLAPHLQFLVDLCGDENFCRLETVQDRPGLFLSGKLFIGRLKLTDFARRVMAEMRRYGERAALAEANQGLDFKALSHAVRALAQVAEIYRTGGLVFPLAGRGELLAIKEGSFGWDEMEPLILTRLREVDELREAAPFTGRHDELFARQALLACYGLVPFPKEAEPKIDSAGNNFSVPKEARLAIENRLADIENEYGVKILYACESGSRGWGFASPDSDYDVRFIYVRPRNSYLSLKEGRDVIERELEESEAGLLDINGWDLAKALKLFHNGNSTLLEWLSSPLVYRDSGHLLARLRRLSPQALSPGKSWRNYHSMMSGRLKSTVQESRSIKAWFYILRPLLALKWLERGLGPVPMPFHQLVEKTVDDKQMQIEIMGLVEMKSRANEKERPAVPLAVVGFIQAELARLNNSPALPPGRSQLNPVELDDLFLTILEETGQQLFEDKSRSSQ